jgi:hypothetical protein
MAELNRMEDRRARGNDARRTPPATKRRNQARSQARARTANNTTGEGDYGAGDPE